MEVAFKDLLSDIVDNRGRTCPTVENGFPLIATNCVKNTMLYPTLAKVRFVDNNTYHSWFRGHPIPGDFVFVTKGSPGEVCVVPDPVPFCIAQDMVAVRANPEKVYPPYLFAALRSKVTQDQISNMHVGTMIPHFKKGDFDKLYIPIPEPDRQRFIGDWYLTISQKIESNRRMNETLEAIAQAIFRDWFVDFGPTRRKLEGATDPVAILGGLTHDPGRASAHAFLFPAALADDGLPEGWEERSVNDDFDVVMGQSPPGSTYNEEGKGLPFFQGRRDFKFRFPERRVYCDAPTRIAEEDWTLLSVRAPVGDINRAWERCCIGRGVGALMHKQGFASLTYYVGLHLKDKLAVYDKDGTVFGAINQKQLKSLKLMATNSAAIRAFDEIAGPMDDLIRSQTDENRMLAAIRDLLLPRLMSGEASFRNTVAVV